MSSQQDRNDRMILAACDGDDAEVRASLEAGAAHDGKDTSNRGSTALQWAAREGNDVVAHTLLEAGAAVNKADRLGCTALQWAAQNGHDQVVRFLLERGAAVNQADRLGWTALQWAARKGHDAAVRTLLEGGADVNKATDTGWTALYWAYFDGHLHCMQMLCGYGADRSSIRAWLRDSTVAPSVAKEIDTWLRSTAQWHSALHYSPWLTESRAEALLRGGADLHARAAPGAPTPLDAVRSDPSFAQLPSCQLVLLASKPWSSASHCLFPAASRRYAEQLAFLVFALRRDNRHDVWWVLDWVHMLLPLLVQRSM